MKVYVVTVRSYGVYEAFATVQPAVDRAVQLVGSYGWDDENGNLYMYGGSVDPLMPEQAPSILEGGEPIFCGYDSQVGVRPLEVQE